MIKKEIKSYKDTNIRLGGNTNPLYIDPFVDCGSIVFSELNFFYTASVFDITLLIPYIT